MSLRSFIMSPIPPEHEHHDNVYGNLTSQSTSNAVERKNLEENSVQIDGFIYNATRLAEIHPGGELFVKVEDQCTIISLS